MMWAEHDVLKTEDVKEKVKKRAKGKNQFNIINFLIYKSVPLAKIIFIEILKVPSFRSSN
jgi:hypothetical protein